MRLRLLQVPVSLMALFLLAGCPELENLPQSDLSCLLSLADGFESPVASGEEVELKVSAQGGNAPYRILGVVGSFESETTVKRTYTNETDEVASQEDSVFIFDRNGRSTQCFATFDVAVADQDGDDDNDDDDDDVTPASVSVSVAPSASVVAGNDIVMTATSAGFDGATVTYTFSYLESGVNIVQNGNVATFSVSDAAAHNVSVTVKAASDTEEATSTVAIQFTLPAPLNCSLKVADGPFITGDTVNVKLQSTSSDELEFASFSAGVTPTTASDGSKNLVYTTAGQKTIYAIGRSKTTGQYCNAGAVMSASFRINSPLSCTASTDYTSYDTYEWIRTLVSIPSHSGKGEAKVTSVATTIAAYGYSFDTGAWVYFTSSGWFQTELTVKDASGATAKCRSNYFYVNDPYYY